MQRVLKLPRPGYFLGIYASILEQDRRFFEQICECQACNEYYDIDWKLNEVSNSDLRTTGELEQQMFEAFLTARNQYASEYAVTREQCRVLSASNSKKVSLHINIPTYVFENNHEQMKAFICKFKDTYKESEPLFE